ncbi:MAG: nucleotidyl transferase AbiEii/AbiGii toxin family protein [Treponema sp.]|jgi:predicted nucleotidyltransferase component of viral defense system|nr:nucleotidyl transferase AbiEii/AbiGii toxin family protein [Treponema sp.]
MAERPAHADLGASLLAKLKNKAKAANISYQQILRLFFQEEFLRRLSKSAYAENFILKGGLFIYTLTNFKSRSTVDIDFMLRRLDNSPERIDKVIAEILAIPTGLNETVLFKAGKSAPIAVQREYRGISCQITGHIKKVRLPFSVDIGIGDVVLPKPEKRIIQPQLEGYEAPGIYTYSLESTIAEKLDAILQRFELTGRMKDFYDIYYLALTFDFEGEKLSSAISETLKNRKTNISPDSFARIVKLADDNDIQMRWRYFQKVLNQTGLALSDVMGLLDSFLHPIFDSLLSGNSLIMKWSADKKRWEYGE